MFHWHWHDIKVGINVMKPCIIWISTIGVWQYCALMSVLCLPMPILTCHRLVSTKLPVQCSVMTNVVNDSNSSELLMLTLLRLSSTTNCGNELDCFISLQYKQLGWGGLQKNVVCMFVWLRNNNNCKVWKVSLNSLHKRKGLSI